MSQAYPEIFKRVVIISEADRLNQESQNMLLKTLEEASENILFILITDKAQFLLPTVISRCWEIKFGPLVESDILPYIEKNFRIQRDVAQKIIKNCENNLAEILDYLSESESFEEIPLIELFRSIWRNEYYSAMQFIIDHNATQEKKNALNLMKRLQMFSQDLLSVKHNVSQGESQMVNLSKNISKQGFKEISSYCIKAENFIKNNINLNLVWMNLILLIRKSFIKPIKK